MNLTTTYLGFELPHPIIVGASPLAYNLDRVCELEDAGAAMLVMPSLFEEQVVAEQLATHYSMATHADSFAEALTYLPDPHTFTLGPHEYLSRIAQIKARVSMPVVASLNGMTPGRWLDWARHMQVAGADAIELNVYYLYTDPDRTAKDIEDHTVEMVESVTSSVKIPVAVKLSPFYTALPALARRLFDAGAKGLVLFNRFYQPDIDLNELEVRRVNLSDPSELLLRLRWLAILSSQIKGSLAASGGVHRGTDAVKAIMAGAHAVQLVSALLQHGPNRLVEVREELARWLEEHEYESVTQLHASMNLSNCPNPAAYERANYMQILQSWEV